MVAFNSSEVGIMSDNTSNNQTASTNNEKVKVNFGQDISRMC